MSVAAIPNCQVRHERWPTKPVRDTIRLCPDTSIRRHWPTGRDGAGIPIR
jgi:hypothetical protein